MKVSHGEGLAIHTDLESCAAVREDGGEALTEERTGRVSSRESNLLRGADAVEEGGRPYLSCRQRKTRRDPARSETLRTHRHISHGNREVRWLPATRVVADRIGKSKDTRR